MLQGMFAVWVYPYIIMIVFAVVSAVLIMVSWPETGTKVVTELPPPPTSKCPTARGISAYMAESNEKERGLEDRHSADHDDEKDVDGFAIDMDGTDDAYTKTKDA
jgi:hypothetical protein